MIKTLLLILLSMILSLCRPESESTKETEQYAGTAVVSTYDSEVVEEKITLSTTTTTNNLVFPNAYYPETGLVSAVDGEVVTITCADGNMYEFTESEFPYWKGDLVSVLFSDNGTANKEDDKIVFTRFAGTLVDYIDLFSNAMEEK